jgi:hypothetical protein
MEPRLPDVPGYVFIDAEWAILGGGGGGSYPGCCTPMSHIGSVHLSGVESLSRRYLIALSRCPFPCLAAVRMGFVCLVRTGEVWPDCDRMLGRERSVVDELNVWANQPERRLGKSPIRELEGEEEPYREFRSPGLLEGLSTDLRGRGIATGSTITGGSSTPSWEGSVRVVKFELEDKSFDFRLSSSLLVLSLSLSLSLRMMRNLLPFFTGFAPVISDVVEAIELVPLAILIALVLRAGSVLTDLERSRPEEFPCFWKNLGSLELPCCCWLDWGWDAAAGPEEAEEASGFCRSFEDIIAEYSCRCGQGKNS